MVNKTKMLHNNVTDNWELTEEFKQYLLSHNIPKCQDPFTIVDKLVMPSVIDACRVVLGPIAATKTSEIPLSNDTVTHRIQDMADDIKPHAGFRQSRTSNWFAIQLDETTDI